MTTRCLSNATGTHGLEIAWTAIPAGIVAILFAATVIVLTHVDSTAATPGVRLDVTAFRWGWTFDYPDEEVAVTGLGGPGEPGPTVVVPVGEPITFTLRSNDVIHSLAIPQFLFKKDVNPGLVNTFQVTVDDAGRLRRPVRRVLRHLPLGDAVHDPCGRAGAVRRVARGAAGRGLRPRHPRWRHDRVGRRS